MSKIFSLSPCGPISFLGLTLSRNYLELLEHFNLTQLNLNICLIVLSGQTLLVTPSLTYSFAANYHLNFPRPAPIWPCSSVSRATVICSGGRGFEPHRVRDFSLTPCGPISFLGLTLRTYYLELLEHFNLSQLNLNISLNLSEKQTTDLSTTFCEL